MTEKQSRGWRELVEGYPWFEEKGCYPIPVYSESMPAPRLGHSVYGDIDRLLFDEEDVYGWRVSEIDQEYELNPGLERIAGQVLAHLVRFGRGEAVRALIGLNRRLLEGNPYWSPEIDAALRPRRRRGQLEGGHCASATGRQALARSHRRIRHPLVHAR